MGKILLVEDDEQLRNVTAKFLRRSGFEVFEAGSCAEARAAATATPPDLLIVDYNLPDGTAFDMLEYAKTQELKASIVVLTGVGTIELAVQSIKRGAEHFLTKPVDHDSLVVIAQRALDLQRDHRRHNASQALTERETRDPFIGMSPRIAEVRRICEAVVGSDAPVLILGETGTGKGVLARWIHETSQRRSEPFVDLNCAGLSREFVESELFGHQRGAFTGAIANKLGLVEVANRGSLFLDEIGDLDSAVQPKLLKVLEDRSFRRLGDVQPRTADVRLVAATHRDLPAMARSGSFRQDLLYRINTLTIELPALRTRAQDIPELSRAMLREMGQTQGRYVPSLTDDALEMLVAYSWPGNIRELRNVLERAVLFAKGDSIDRATLGFDRALQPEEPAEVQTLDDAERRHITSVLKLAGGRVDDAARVLDLSRSSLYAKLKKYGIKTAER
ncbi:MAG: sigma-54 dependent transcriptional regulator [Polyangiaceae bacterium]